MFTLLMLIAVAAKPESPPMMSRQLITVKAADLAAANAAAVKVFGRKATGMFSVKFNDGKDPTKPKVVTHYAASLLATKQQMVDFKKEMASQITGNKVVVYSKPTKGKLEELKLKPVITTP